jgi:hypothetical protein
MKRISVLAVVRCFSGSGRCRLRRARADGAVQGRRRRDLDRALHVLADRSRFFSPALIVSLQANLDLSLGVQLFGGSQGSEYARLRDLYYAQVQWFF